MSYSFIRVFFTVLLLLFTLKSTAQTDEQFLVVQKCLLSTGFQYETLADDKGLYLIKTSQLTRLQTATLKKPRRCKGFMNVTSAWQSYVKQKNSNAETFLQRYQSNARPSDLMRGYRIKYQDQVKSLLPGIDSVAMQKHLQRLTAFSDRHVNSEDGLAASNWVKQQVDMMVAASVNKDVAVYQIATPGAKQFSVMLKLGKDVPGPAVLIGAHLDTLRASYNNKKPGADDGGSGVVVTLEAARALLNSPLKFNKPIYFIWYAGTEDGMLGSQRIVQYFNQNKLPVEAVLQLDMTGYVGKDGMTVGLTDDLTDAGLTAFIADLIAAYVKVPAGVVRCGYACSDHVSWHLNGNRVAYPFETMDDQGNPAMHTRNDVIENLSFEHMKNFVKLGIAFAVELAEPVVDKR